jgi:hypothetical protein
MSNQPMITIRNAATGELITVPSGQAAKMATAPKPPRDNTEFTPYWKLVAGQAGDERMPKAYGNLFLMRQVLQEDGSYKAETHNLGESVTVYPVGLSRSRTYMPEEYKKGVKRDPLCKSADYFNPTADYFNKTIGGGSVVALACCSLDENGKIVDSCPLAQWERVPETDKQGNAVTWPNGKPKYKSIPPRCKKSYTVAAAVVVGDAIELVEIEFKRSVEKDGESLYTAITATLEEGLAAWSYELTLNWTAAGSGGVIKPSMGDSLVQFEEDQLTTLRSLATKYEQITNRRILDGQSPRKKKEEQPTEESPKQGKTGGKAKPNNDPII